MTAPVAYTYDALYRQISLTDGNDHTTLFAYDSKGRLALIRYPLATADQGYDTVRFTLYDDAGRLLRRIDGRENLHGNVERSDRLQHQLCAGRRRERRDQPRDLYRRGC